MPLVEDMLTWAINKLVLFYPAFCIPDDARAGKMIFARFDPNNLPGVIKCGPMKLGKCYVEDVIRMNPFEEIKYIRIAIQREILDWRCWKMESMAFREELIKLQPKH